MEELVKVYEIYERGGKRRIEVRPELCETEPRHADMLRYDVAFADPNNWSRIVFPRFSVRGEGLMSKNITWGRWQSFGLEVLAGSPKEEFVTGLENWIGYVHEGPNYALRRITLGEYLKEHPKHHISSYVGWR